jgi:outer membrane usher protein
LLRGASSSAIDLSRFERGDPTPPGLHALDVIRNGASIGRRMIRFAAHAPDTPARPCFDRALGDAVGLALARLTSQHRTALGDPLQCVNISELIPAARAEYDPARLALDVSLPQAALVDVSRDAIDPALRDAGIPAFRMSYALNALHHDDHRRDIGHTQASMRTELGANAGRWRWRHRGTHTWRSGTRVRGNTLSAPC